ncbi:hypothetical protein P8452_41641 [Trifolium repens]|nr:hypothetical protein P8452_41641 [Trifolium repens]
MVQSITFSISKGMAKWACSAIYASPTYTARIELWTHLQNLRNNIFIPWLMIGDFNEVKSIVEVSGCSFNYSRANIFRDMSTHSKASKILIFFSHQLLSANSAKF